MTKQTHPPLFICTVASERNAFLEQLLHSARLHGHVLDVLGMEAPFRGYAEKFCHVIKYLKKLPDDALVLFVDAYDTLFLAPSDEIVAKFLRLHAPFVVSAERRICPPCDLYGPKHPESETGFRYLNSGAYLGYVKVVRKIFDGLGAFSPEDNDQALMMKHFVDNQKAYRLDTHCKLFLSTATLRLSDMVFNYQLKRVKSVQTKTMPCILHGNEHSVWYQYAYNTFFLSDPLPDKALAEDTKKLFIAIHARQCPYILEKYLRSIEALDYDKKQITLSIHVLDTHDKTAEICRQWARRQEGLYECVLYESEEAAPMASFHETAWFSEHAKIPAYVYEKSLKKAQESGCDYYFVADCDHFVAPQTIRALMAKKVPIAAPFLRNIPEHDYTTTKDFSSTFFYEVTDDGSFKGHENYLKIFNHEMVGAFQVPHVFGALLIDGAYLSQVTYEDASQDLPHQVFSRSARNKKIAQYISNEKNFGARLHYCDVLTQEQVDVLTAFLCTT